MPLPTSKYSTDYYLYEFILNPIAKRICFISPNFITFIGLIVIIFIYLNLLYKSNIIIFIILILIRSILDCLDGSVARICDKQSRFGVMFDILSDTLFNALLLIYIIYYFINKKGKYKVNFVQIILFIIGIITILFMLFNVYNELIDNRSKVNLYFNNYFDEFFHDNSVILISLYCIAIKYSFV